MARREQNQSSSVVCAVAHSLKHHSLGIHAVRSAEHTEINRVNPCSLETHSPAERTAIGHRTRCRRHETDQNNQGSDEIGYFSFRWKSRPVGQLNPTKPPGAQAPSISLLATCRSQKQGWEECCLPRGSESVGEE